jgi:GNAT superfamily N-acetyltransferase
MRQTYNPFPMSFKIESIEQDNLEAAFPAIQELRPHLDKEAFVMRAKKQMKQGYFMVGIPHGQVFGSVAGFRFGEYLAWGSILYVDDLVTLSSAQGLGYAGAMMDWLIGHAKSKGCDGLHLDSGYQRIDAHRLYLKKRLKLASHHFSIQL